MAGVSAERQESSVVEAVKKAFKKNKKNPITIVAGNITLEGIIDAEKYSGRQITGSEPYTDVIFTAYDKKEYNCSLKGEAAPSLAGGGLRGLELAVPGIGKKFLKNVHEYLTKEMKLKPGDKVPDVYGKISKSNKLKIVIGNKQMGGPIDYMYIGKMDVKSNYDLNKNILVYQNGELIPADYYAKTHDLYFRLRARREDQRFDPSAQAAGVPKIYGKSPSRGDSAGRIVVTDKVPKNAVIIDV
jgi:hypothetical protein